MLNNNFFIENVNINPNSAPYFIAEIGSNFDGSLSRAKDLIYLAKDSGAQAVKFQHYTADTLVSDYAFKALGNNIGHQKEWNKSVYETYKSASLNPDWTEEIADTCKKVGLHFMTSPYSIELVDFVDKYVSAFKIGSGDITWLEIINKISKKNKPVFLATGASSLEDVVRAMSLIQSNNERVVLMQCNTNYSVNNKNIAYQNLRVLNTYREIFPGVILGFSDHTAGYHSILGAYSLGARVFEKHFTDDNSRAGPDHKFAMTPSFFKDMVIAVSDLESALGSPFKTLEANEYETVIIQRRAIHASRDIKSGEFLSLNDIVFLRPCPKGGIPPYKLNSILGAKVKINLKKGQTIMLNDIETKDGMLYE